jgi:hypothetical protein
MRTNQTHEAISPAGLGDYILFLRAVVSGSTALEKEQQDFVASFKIPNWQIGGLLFLVPDPLPPFLAEGSDFF